MQGKRVDLPRLTNRGLTLLELIVVMAIVGVLVALLLVAIQQGRESARRSHCLSNLRQIALGMSSYEATYNAFPPTLTDVGSVFGAVLPFTEQSAVHDEVMEYHRSGKDPFKMDIFVPLFECPSDNVQSFGVAGTSYSGNVGTWLISDGFNGMFRFMQSLGGDLKYGPVRVSEVTAGLSNTALISEILRGDTTYSRLRVVWNTPRSYRNPTELAAFTNRCNSIPLDATAYGWLGSPGLRGTPWTDGNITVTLYNHASTPGNPSCFNKGAVLTALATATSRHSTVGVAFADAHTESIATTIDKTAWRQISSRNARN